MADVSNGAGKPGRRDRAEGIKAFLIAAVALKRRDPVAEACRRFAVTRQAVNRHLRLLVASGAFRATGATRGRKYDLVVEKHSREYALGPDLKEDRAWREFVRPLLGSLCKNVLGICQYGLTEMLNNAIEHSEGTKVVVSVKRSVADLEIEVVDDGIGIFRKIRDSFGLEDQPHAVLELSKGRLTTDPEHHTGEGIYFTSRVFDRFGILAGTLNLATSSDQGWLLETGDSVKGTKVGMRISPSSRMTLKEVFDRHASSDHHYRFSVTHVPVSLASIGDENLVSRSQARRLVTRLDLFDEVVLDFRGVKSIGQAFADEVFRVFARDHPRMELQWLDANEEVEQMISRALAARAEEDTKRVDA